MGEEQSGTDGAWVRDTGVVVFDQGAVSIRVAEPVLDYGVRPCRLPVVDILVFRPSGARFKLVPSGRDELDVFYLSDSAIRAVGEFFVADETVLDPDTLNFEVGFGLVNPVCSATEGAPDESRYEIGIATEEKGSPVETFDQGTVTRWDRNIRVISLGPEVSGTKEYGMTMRISVPLRPEGDRCVTTTFTAQLTIVDNEFSPPDVRFYAFPREGKGEVSVNDFLTVDFLDDVVISGQGRIPMQRQDAEGWLEEVWVTVGFDAFEPGYDP